MAFIDNPENFNCKKNFIFRGKEIIVQNFQNNLKKADDAEHILPSEQIMNRCLAFNMGYDWFVDSVVDCAVMGLSEDDPNPAGCTAIPLRKYFSLAGDEESALAARAKSYLEWRSSTRFCSICGGRLENYSVENARICKNCNKIVYPRIEPCIIVLVSKGEEILLAKNKNNTNNMYACIAGFVEAGETIEQAVCREVLEETGIKIKNLTYKGSQGWPFPDQLMLSFTAEYESGEIKIQEEELSDAKWIKRSDLHKFVTPQPGSAAYKLINSLF